MDVLGEPEVQKHELFQSATQTDVVEFNVAVANVESMEYLHTS